MSAALHLALNHWQYHEDLWLRGDPQAKAGVLEGIMLIRETCRVMDNLVRRKATTALLPDIMPLIAAEQADTQAICYLPRPSANQTGVDLLANVQHLAKYRQ